MSIIFLIIFYIFFSLNSHCIKYAFKNYSSSEGLPQSQVISITQDSIGKIWVSTHCGIAYYDGYKFNTINKKMGLPTNYVYNILFQDNKIFGGGSYSIFTIDLSEKSDINVLQLPYIVRNFLPVKNGILFASDDGLFLAGENNKILKISSALPANGKNIFIKEGNCVYYLGKNSIYKINENFSIDRVFSSSLNFKTFNLTEKGLLIGADEGLFLLSKENLIKIKELPLVQDIMVDKEDLWVGTNNGLYLIQNGKASFIGKEEGLPSDSIYCLFKDRENILWIGTDNGISKLQSLGFENFVSEKGLFSGSIWSFLEISDKKILIGGDKGLGIIKDGKLEEIDLGELKGSAIRSLSTYKNEILLAFKNKGIYSISLKNGFKLKKFINKKIDGIFSIYSDKNNGLWICTRNGLYYYFEDKIKFFNKKNGLPDDTVFKVVEDLEGNILVLTDGGVAEFSNNSFLVPSLYGFLKGNSIRSILFDKEKIWVATLGNGLFYYNGNRWENISEKNGLPSDNLWSIEKDDLGFLWFGSNRGIVMYAEGYSCLFNSNDGLKGGEVILNSILKTKDGKIWFGLINGALRLNPFKIEPNLNPPNLYIEKIESDTGIFLPYEKVNLKPKDKRISIYFNGLSFQDETEIFYSYRLYPLEDWSKPTQERKVTYTNLKPGNYLFELKACNASWIWKDNPLKLDINKLPYFYEKTSFKIIVSSIFLLFFYAFFKIRIKAIRKDKEKLERIVNDKTKALQERLKELYVLSTTDFLTKVFNRGHFEKLLNEEIKRAKRENGAIGLAILDLDHFKDLNDEFGHSTGDGILIEFGKLLNNTFRSTDIIARYGGDEFVILFISAEPEGCIPRLKDLMAKVKGFVYESENKKVQLSLSIGVVFASFTQEKKLTIETIRRIADNALYEAKNKGRDNIVIYRI